MQLSICIVLVVAVNSVQLSNQTSVPLRLALNGIPLFFLVFNKEMLSIPQQCSDYVCQSCVTDDMYEQGPKVLLGQ